MVRNGSYGQFQRYLCKDCDRTFNDKTGTIFAHSKIALRKWLFSIYAFLRFNTSLRQLQCEIEVTYKTIHRRVERFTEALGAPSLDLRGPVEIDEFYVSAGLSRRGRGTYEQDKPPVFVLVDRGTEQRYLVPAKSANESTIRLLLAVSQQEPLTVYTDGFRAYNPLKKTRTSSVNTSFTATANTPTTRST